MKTGLPRLGPISVAGLLVGLLLTVALHGVRGEDEVESLPSEVQCRPYIEKALKGLGTGPLEQQRSPEDESGSQEDDGTDVDQQQQQREQRESDSQESQEANEETESLDDGQSDEVITDTDTVVGNDDGASAEAGNDDDSSAERATDDSNETQEETHQDDDETTDSREVNDDDRKTDDSNENDSVETVEEAIENRDDDSVEKDSVEQDGDDNEEDGNGSDENGALEEVEKSDEDNEETGEEESKDGEDSGEAEEADDGLASVEDSKVEETDSTEGDESGQEDSPSAEDNADDGSNEADAKSDDDKSGEDDAGKSGEDDDGKSGEDDDGKSGEEEAAKSGEDDDVKSGEEEAAKSGEDDDGKSGEEDAADSGEVIMATNDEDSGENANEESNEDGNASVQTDSGEAGNEGSDENAVSDGQESREIVEDNDKEGSEETAEVDDKDKDSKEDNEETAEVDDKDSKEVDGDGVSGQQQESKEEDTEGDGKDASAEDEDGASRRKRETDDENEDSVEGAKKEDSGEEEQAGGEGESRESGEDNGEVAPTPEEDLILEIEIPENLRPREHINQLLRVDDENAEKERAIEKAAEVILKDLKKLYDTAIQPLETLYKYRDLSNRHFGDPEIFSKPLVLFMGPWSGGKSSIINYLLDLEYTPNALRTGAEPSPAYFNILMHGTETEVLDGTQLAADWTFSGLQKFGQGMLDRLRGLKINNKLLERVNIVEIPGILEIRKQVQRIFPFNDACQWFIDRADIIFLVYDPSKLDVGPETEAILDQLKGREYQTRIILNKADQVKPEELMRVQGALIWNISPLMSSAEPPIMYSTSLWSMPYEAGAPTRLLYAQERAFLRDLRSAIDKRVEHKIASARRFAVRVRNHAKMVDCYLTTYYNHKSFFGNKKEMSDRIIENPQDYHIYEGLSTLTNISRYDLPDPAVYRDFFRLNSLYDFQPLSSTCTYFRGCPINRLDVAIAYDLPELVGKYKKSVEAAMHETETNNGQPSAS